MKKESVVPTSSNSRIVETMRAGSKILSLALTAAAIRMLLFSLAIILRVYPLYRIVLDFTSAHLTRRNYSGMLDSAFKKSNQLCPHHYRTLHRLVSADTAATHTEKILTYWILDPVRIQKI